jgi:glycosyltransferase involved in cell wall biosynthesis
MKSANKVKVAVIHNTIAPYRHPLFEELAKRVELTVYYCAAKHASRAWDLWPRNYNYEYKILPRIPIKILSEEASLNFSIIKEILRNRPDVMIIGGYVDPTMWLALFTAKLLKIPVIYWTEGMKEPQTLLGALTRPIRILFVKKADAIIVPGKLSKQYVISLGANSDKVFIAPNSIDNNLFISLSQRFLPLKEKIKKELNLSNKIVILTVAQLIKRKGLEFLVQAYAMLERERKETALVIVGSGPLRQHLEELSKSLGVKNIKFIPTGLKLEELVKLYCIADVFVLPTLEDIWGFVINEAMACGLPVISTTASQAAREMIHLGRNGYIVKPARADQLYLALKAVVSNPTRMAYMKAEARKIVEKNFGVEATVKGFLDAIEHCLTSIRKSK